MEYLLLGAVALIFFIAIKTSRSQHSLESKQYADRLQWGSSQGLEIVDKPAKRRFLAELLTGVPHAKLDNLRPLIPKEGTAFNFLEGYQGGRKVQVFDLRVPHPEGSYDYHCYVVIEVQSPGPFEIQPRTTMHKIGELFTYTGLKLKNPIFDERFHVTEKSDEFVLTVIDDELRKRMLLHIDYTFICQGSHLVLKKDRLCANEELEEMLAVGMLFAMKIEERG